VHRAVSRRFAEALRATPIAIAARGFLAVLCLLAGAATCLAASASAQTNLLRNPGAQTGAVSALGWDSVTIPGWNVVAGLPTVVRYGTRGFPGGHRRGQLFAGGPGGSALLTQPVALPRRGDGSPARYSFSARLGASSSSHASASITFLSPTGRRIGRRNLRGVGGRGRSSARRLTRESLRGRVPAGATSAEVALRLTTSLKNIDGPYSPKVGYDRAVADDLRFALRAAAPAPAAPPVARVPRYRHVFLFYFENQDVRAIVGDRRKAPYYNRLLSQGSELGQMYAEEHPSDGNYLALAGGSTFGVPLTDPLEINSQYTIHAANIGDQVDAAGETWKDYEQSSAGPCDDTVHGFYWNDDLPMLYFADIRDRPAYCAAHDVPLEALASDLAQPETTPNFSWVGVNDCDDMEGCGIRAGDRFLAKQLGEIMRSPAWQTQRSLAIITFDEDAVDHEQPAQRVPTLLLASTGVRHGYVSNVRYTHYSLLRTIEAALGLKALTGNDRFAQPVNDVFAAGAAPAQPPPSPAHVSPTASPAPRASSAGRATHRPPPAGPSTAFVVSSQAGTVTPVALADRRAGRPIAVGRDPQAIALSPDQRMAYVVNSGSDSVTPIETGPRRRERLIAVGRDPQAIVVTPDGRTAFVSNAGSDTVTPIDLRTDAPGKAIPVGTDPHRLAITPDGRTLYVLDWGGHAVTPIDVRSERALPSIRVGSYPSSIVIGNRGRAYVANYGSNTVTPITISDQHAGPSIAVGQAPSALMLSPDGARLLVVDGDTDRLTTLATDRLRQIHDTRVGVSPEALSLSRSGTTANVVNTISGTITPVNIATGRAGTPISVGTYAYPTQVIPAPSGRTAVVLGTYAGTVRLVDTRTRSASRPVKVGALPVAAAITR
jgi:YVTN family beta-propeller protein